ncbi:SGNH/GDSL hydrolase family protein [Paenibacillus xanthanilyticus]|uniref:SGNH/GDSL hydrolase family protein n=1 Tax=Paenibacillus xanthanilyticus TaxID=1783531 RepID=A0ABV8K8S0_9BACL
MDRISITEAWFAGAVSVERTADGLKPWRIPYADYPLYPPDGIGGKAEIAAGIRLRFRTDATQVKLLFAPLMEAAQVDCHMEGTCARTADLAQGETSAAWEGLPAGHKTVELWLPQQVPITIIAVYVEPGAYAEPEPDLRPRWVAYGSSITQCVAAAGPTQTWPAIAAHAAGLNLTCLGYSGNCQLETMVGRLIRDLPADLITLCLGINVYGAASLSARTFRPAVIGMVQSIREKHEDTPLVLISPIYASEREDTPNKLDMTVRLIREEIAEAAALLQRRGDRALHYRDGLAWFGVDDAAHLPDGLHPDATGYRLMGERFVERILGDINLGSNR